MPDIKPIIRQSDKSDKLTIRCSEEFKRIVSKEAIDRSTSIENLCVSLIAAGLGLEVEIAQASETSDAA